MSVPETANTERYFDRVVTALVMFSMMWAVIGMAVGVYVAAELIWPTLDFGQPWLSFGRLRTLHTNGIIFGFGVSALMGTAFYSVQRTSHVPLFARNWPGSAVRLAARCLPADCRCSPAGPRRRNTPSSNGRSISRSLCLGLFRHRVFSARSRRKDQADLHFELVLRRADHRHRNAAYRQQSGDSGTISKSYSLYRRRAGCDRAMVVRA